MVFARITGRSVPAAGFGGAAASAGWCGAAPATAADSISGGVAAAAGISSAGVVSAASSVAALVADSGGGLSATIRWASCTGEVSPAS